MTCVTVMREAQRHYPPIDGGMVRPIMEQTNSENRVLTDAELEEINGGGIPGSAQDGLIPLAKPIEAWTPSGGYRFAPPILRAEELRLAET